LKLRGNPVVSVSKIKYIQVKFANLKGTKFIGWIRRC